MKKIIILFICLIVASNLFSQDLEDPEKAYEAEQRLERAKEICGLEDKCDSQAGCDLQNECGEKSCILSFIVTRCSKTNLTNKSDEEINDKYFSFLYDYIPPMLFDGDQCNLADINKYFFFLFDNISTKAFSNYCWGQFYKREGTLKLDEASNLINKANELLKKAGEDSKKADQLKQKAEQLLQQAESLIQETASPFGNATLYYNQAIFDEKNFIAAYLTLSDFYKYYDLSICQNSSADFVICTTINDSLVIDAYEKVLEILDEMDISMLNKTQKLIRDDMQLNLLFLEGDLYKHAGDLNKAMEIYNKLLELEPENPEIYDKIYNNMGDIYLAQGLCKLAYQMYEKAGNEDKMDELRDMCRNL